MFDTKSDKELHGSIKNVLYIRRPRTLTLYRGIDSSDELQREGGGYILDNSKFPDKAIWFSQSESFAEGYADYALITYKLSVVQHGVKEIYDDGYEREDFHVFEQGHLDLFRAYFEHPEFGIKKGDNIGTNMSNDWPFYGGMELPGGWSYSYKVQKHITCNVPLYLSGDMVEIKNLEEVRRMVRNILKEVFR